MRTIVTEIDGGRKSWLFLLTSLLIRFRIVCLSVCLDEDTKAALTTEWNGRKTGKGREVEKEGKKRRRTEREVIVIFQVALLLPIHILCSLCCRGAKSYLRSNPHSAILMIPVAAWNSSDFLAAFCPSARPRPERLSGRQAGRTPYLCSPPPSSTSSSPPSSLHFLSLSKRHPPSLPLFVLYCHSLRLHGDHRAPPSLGTGPFIFSILLRYNLRPFIHRDRTDMY